MQGEILFPPIRGHTYCDRVTYPTGFGVDLRCRMAKAIGNQVCKLTRVEQADFKKIERQAFPKTLVLDFGQVLFFLMLIP